MQPEPLYDPRRAAHPAAPGFASSNDPAPWAAPGADEPAGTTLGTRILGYVAATLLGALFAAIGTVVHQIDVSVFGLFDLPVGLVLALVAIALLLTGLRMIAPTRVAAALAAAALVGVVALLTLESAGGSVLVPAGPVGLVWLFGSTLIAVIVIAWPRLGPRRPHGSAAVAVPGGSARPDAVDSTW